MLRFIFLLCISLAIGLHVEPIGAQDLKYFLFGVLTIKKTANQKKCTLGENCTYTIEITNWGAPICGEINFRDWVRAQGGGGGVNVRFVSVSEPWSCTANSYLLSGWKCTGSGICLGTNESTTFEITVEFGKDYTKLYAQNCAAIGHGASPTKLFNAGGADCADDVALLGPAWPKPSEPCPKGPGGWPECPAETRTAPSQPGTRKSSTGLGKLPEPPSSTTGLRRPHRPTGRGRQPAGAGQLPTAPAGPPPTAPPVGTMVLPRR